MDSCSSSSERGLLRERCQAVTECFPEPVRSALRPPQTFRGWMVCLMAKFPILEWVWSYRLGYLPGDIMSGFIVAIVAVPQGLAYALLANVPPVYGLYSFFVPPIFYSVFGTSRHTSIGAFAVLQLVLANSIEEVFGSHSSLQSCVDSPLVNGTDPLVVSFGGRETTCEAVKLDVVFTLAFISGAFMVLMGLLQLGFVSIFLSEPMVSGYTVGAAVLALTSQLQSMTGLGGVVKVHQGSLKAVKTWVAVLSNVASFNWATVLTSMLALIFLIVLEFLNSRLRHPRCLVPVWVYDRNRREFVKRKFQSPVPVPSYIIVIVMAITISHLASLEESYGVKSLGYVPNGLPGVSLPNPRLLGDLMKDALVVSIITYSMTVSVARVLAKKWQYSIDANQEFLALGIVNFISSFFSSFSVSGSLTRSHIQADAGGRTQLAGFITSLVMMVVLLKLGPLFQKLPQAILGAIVWVALYGTLTQFKDLYRYFKISPWDGITWLVTFLGTSLLGVDWGLAVGVSCSFLMLLLRITIPFSSACGHHCGSFEELKTCRKMELTSGTVVFRFPSPLCSSNALVFRRQLEVLCDYEKKSAQQSHSAKSVHSYSAANVYYSSLKDSIEVRSRIVLNQRAVYTMIVDCSGISFIDATGVKTLEEVVEDFSKIGIQTLLVANSKDNKDTIMRSKYFQNLEDEWSFSSVAAAQRYSQL